MRDLLDADEFREVLKMDPDAQRELLRSDDPRYRIWAAWALGLSLAEGFAESARDLLSEEPVAGVRRHLVVMMAGFGEVDIVAALARHDPDDYVRATAARYVAELSVQHSELRDVLADCLRDGSRRVRAAALERLPDEAPAELWATVADAARDEDVELRRSATRRLLALEPLPTILFDRLFDEPMKTIRMPILETMLDRLGLSVVYREARRRDRIGRLVRYLGATERTLSWEEFEKVGRTPDFLRVVDAASLPTAGRIWLMDQAHSHRVPMLSYVARAYEGVREITDAAERDAVLEYTSRLDKHLATGEASEGAGELVEWGTLFETDPLAHRVLTHLRELVRPRY